MTLSIEELARQAGTTPAQIERFVDLGILDRQEGTAGFYGDGVMFHFADPGDAVACALRLVGAADEEGLPPARAGVHTGPVVFRDGDYFGQTVNLASRIGDYARPREVLVSVDVVEQAKAAARFEPIGDISLRGVSEPVPLVRAVPRDSSPGG